MCILVNASGFGKFGTYKDLSLQEIDDMIDLNCKAAVNLTMITLPHTNKNARIIEICPASAFQPLPELNIYGRNKGFSSSLLTGTQMRTFPTVDQGYDHVPRLGEDRVLQSVGGYEKRAYRQATS